MGAYVDSIKKPPKSLTQAEQDRLLTVTGDRRGGFRDHMIYSLALGTGLREHELAALNVGDVFHKDGTPRRFVQIYIFKGAKPGSEPQSIILPDSARYKLEKYWGWKHREGQSLEPAAPLFLSRKNRRISTRQLRHGFARWGERAGFERRLSFHALRHTSCLSFQRQWGDLRATQRFARHKSPNSTAIYTQPSDEDMLRAVRDLPC